MSHLGGNIGKRWVITVGTDPVTFAGTSATEYFGQLVPFEEHARVFDYFSF